MLYLERLHFPLILGNNKWKLACLALHGPTLPLGAFSREIADGKIKVQGKKQRGKQGGGSKGRSFQVLSFNTQVTHTNSVA